MPYHCSRPVPCKGPTLRSAEGPVDVFTLYVWIDAAVMQVQRILPALLVDVNAPTSEVKNKPHAPVMYTWTPVSKFAVHPHPMRHYPICVGSWWNS